MSDDGYYAYSPYDELEDMLYDADPSPDLAEDLAEHTAPSPVYYDMPGGELLNYHSDWEYYSDDFYDDDPALAKDSTAPDRTRFSGDKRNPVTARDAKRGRKRKLAEIEDIAPIDLGERRTLLDCLKGTVWARPIRENGPVYSEGQQEKVALLKNWKDRWGTPLQNNIDQGRRQLQRDESWANEMSLADMGLQNARSHSLAEAAEEKGEQVFDDEEDEEEEGVEEQDYDVHADQDGEEGDGQEVPIAGAVDSGRNNASQTNGEDITKSTREATQRQNGSSTKDISENMSSESAEHPQKRIKTYLPPISPTTHHKTDMAMKIHSEEAEIDSIDIRASRQAGLSGDRKLNVSSIPPNSTSIVNTKKRRASPDFEEVEENTSSQYGNQGKRKASRKGPTADSTSNSSGPLRRGPDRRKKS